MPADQWRLSGFIMFLNKAHTSEISHDNHTIYYAQSCADDLLYLWYSLAISTKCPPQRLLVHYFQNVDNQHYLDKEFLFDCLISMQIPIKSSNTMIYFYNYFTDNIFTETVQIYSQKQYCKH